MLKYLVPFMRTSAVLIELDKAKQQELSLAVDQVEDLFPQLDVSTATWGLSVYEKELGIKTDLTIPIESRRSNVKAKMRGIGKVDAMQIKLVADAYTNGDCTVSFNGRIVITFNSVVGVPPRLEDLKAALDEIKPAGLAIEYVFRYLLIEDVDGSMTLEQLESTTLENFAGGE